jgi:hypothetical protein
LTAGSYSPASTATLEIGVSGPSVVGSDFGQLKVNGAANVAGTLALSTAPGFTPALGTTYTVLTAGSLTGTFPNVTGTLIGSGPEEYSVSYTGTSVVLTVVEPPAVTSASSTTFISSSPGSFTVTTTGFPTPSLSESGMLPTGVTFTDNGNGTATITGPGSAGTFPISITASNGVNPNASQTFTLRELSVSSLKPNTLAQGVKSLSVSLTGTGFSSGATLQASNAGITFSSVSVSSTTTISAKAMVLSSVPTGSYNVSLNDGSTSASCTACLKVLPQPSVSGISPNTLGQGANTISATVSGTSFVSPATVKFSGPSTGVTAKVSSVSSASLTVKVTVSSTAATGAYTLKLTNGDGGTATCSSCLTVVTGPTISSMSPTTVVQGTTNSFTMNGTGFSSDAKLIGPTGVTFSSIVVNGSGTQITATMKVASTAPTGSTLPVTEKEGPLGNFGSATDRGLTIT